MESETQENNVPTEENKTPEAENGAPLDSETVEDSTDESDDDEPARVMTTAERRAEAIRVAKDGKVPVKKEEEEEEVPVEKEEEEKE